MPDELVLMPRDGIQRELVVKRSGDEVIVQSVVSAGFGETWSAGWAMSRKFSIAYRPASAQVLELRVGDACFDVTPREAMRIANFLKIPLPVLPAVEGSFPSPPRESSAVGNFLDVHA